MQSYETEKLKAAVTKASIGEHTAMREGQKRMNLILLEHTHQHLRLALNGFVVAKANAESAKLKRELQARMSEEERREAERKAKEDEVNEKLAELQRAKIVSGTKAQ